MDLMSAANENFLSENSTQPDILEKYLEFCSSEGNVLIDYNALFKHMRKLRIAETRERLGLQIVNGSAPAP